MRIAILFTRSKLRPAASDAVAGKLATIKAHERWENVGKLEILYCDMDHQTASYQHSDMYCLPVLVMCVVPGKWPWDGLVGSHDSAAVDGIRPNFSATFAAGSSLMRSTYFCQIRIQELQRSRQSVRNLKIEKIINVMINARKSNWITTGIKAIIRGRRILQNLPYFMSDDEPRGFGGIGGNQPDILKLDG